MQHIIHFAIFLVLATAHLTSAAVNTVLRVVVRQKTKSTAFVSKPSIPELCGGSKPGSYKNGTKNNLQARLFHEGLSECSMREGCQIGCMIYAVESVMS